MGCEGGDEGGGGEGASPASESADQEPPRSMLLGVAGITPAAIAFSNSSCRKGERRCSSLSAVCWHHSPPRRDHVLYVAGFVSV